MVEDEPRHDEAASLAPSARRASAVPRLRVTVGAAIVVVIGVITSATLVTVLGAPNGSEQVPKVSFTDSPTHSPEGGADATAAAVVFVHVLGAVSRPGLYQLRAGSRVVDALAAAGGLTSDAEPAGVNLARPVGDGEQLVVPRVGEAPPPAEQQSASGGAGGRPGAKVNLNTASAAELETLPRVGPALAARILSWRTENGRFATIDDLKNVSGIGDKTFEQLKALVTV